MAKYGKGKDSFGICDRSGFKVRYSEMVKEPGTGYWVHKSESDGRYSAVNHPQNFPPRPRAESLPLRFARSGKNEITLHTLLTETGSVLLTESGDPIVLDE